MLYVYEKQLEEAEIVVLNKIDIISTELRQRLESTLAARFPLAAPVSVSARTGQEMAQWLEGLLATSPAARPTMDVDYDLYAAGEADLGWLNATVRLDAARGFDGNRFLARLAAALRERLAGAAVEIAHLKMALADDDAADHGTIHLVRTEGVAEISRRLETPIRGGKLTVNLRAEADPDCLHALLLWAIAEAGREAEVAAIVESEAHFRPGRPVPTHRMQAR